MSKSNVLANKDDSGNAPIVLMPGLRKAIWQYW